MIIWRGWGVIAFGYAALAMILFGAVASTIVSASALPFSIAIGLLLAAVATWYTGQAMNVRGPQRKIDAWLATREQQLDDLVESGRFSMGPGQPPPTSYEEAREQSQLLLEHERAQVQRARNVHTLFFVPMQYWAFVLAAIAITVAVMGIIVSF